MKVLVIDDNEHFAAVLCDCLREAGFTVLLAASGGEGVKKACSAHPDLILLDHHPGDISGEEVADELALKRGPAGIPIILLSAMGDVVPAHSGFKVVISKSLPAFEIVDTVKAFGDTTRIPEADNK